MTTAPSYAKTNFLSIIHMKREEMIRAIKEMAKNGAFNRMVGSMVTADAKETDATAKKTTKTAVNELNRLLLA